MQRFVLVSVNERLYSFQNRHFMRYGKSVLLAIFLHLSIWVPLSAQSSSLEEVESQLKEMAVDILMHDSLSHKIKVNKQFAKLLINTLKRPESFSYPFDSLTTISILKAEDNSFRLITWHIVDRNYNEYEGDQYYYYFGFVQRKYVNDQGKTEYLVIPLIETQQVVPEMEHMVLDNTDWLGAQYYLPKYRKKIPKYTLSIIPPDTTNKYVIGRNDPDRYKKRKQDIYLLFGWNGFDNRTNYKVLDVMYFDPKDPTRVLFGAETFIYQKVVGEYFDQRAQQQKQKKMFISKHRILFKYSDNAPFSLNMAYVKRGLFGKKEMVVFDHLSEGSAPGMEVRASWEIGPDGSVDAMSFVKRNGGYFQWYSDVTLAEKYNRKLSRDNQKVYELYHPDDKLSAKITQKTLRERAKAEKKRLKEAGIELDQQKKKKDN